jgi:hypothetical protein
MLVYTKDILARLLIIFGLAKICCTMVAFRVWLILRVLQLYLHIIEVFTGAKILEINFVTPRIMIGMGKIFGEMDNRVDVV